jgi:hypothetical protein
MKSWWASVVVGALVAASIVLAAPPVAAADDSVMAICDGQPCADGWYTAPVTLTWDFSSAPTTTLGCDEIAPSSGDLIQTASCQATWPSETLTRTYTLQVETSDPTATASLARPPDVNGWYDHPVAVSFAGNSFSGISSCSPPITYSGPAAAGAMVSGSCTDNAGKTAYTSAAFDYDATPPTISGATPSRSPDYNGWYTRPVSFAFRGTDGPSGIDHCQTVTYAGPVSGSVTGGCWDRAGNYAEATVPVSYLQVVAKPGERVASVPLLLRWKSRSHASYYNLQIYSSGHKVLSTWPSRTSLLIRRSWRFHRRRFQLKPGRYHWYVWPGYGSRAADRYGRRMVSATFTVT